MRQTWAQPKKKRWSPADPAVNYGGIGAVIGHEMGHGYDDQGAKSDQRSLEAEGFQLFLADARFQRAIVRPVHLWTILRQQQPCGDDPVGTVQPDGSGIRVVLIRASAEGFPGREAAGLEDIIWLERVLLEAPAFEQTNRRRAFQRPANRFAVLRLLFHDDGGVGIGPGITDDDALHPDGCRRLEYTDGVMGRSGPGRTSAATTVQQLVILSFTEISCAAKRLQAERSRHEIISLLPEGGDCRLLRTEDGQLFLGAPPTPVPQTEFAWAAGNHLEFFKNASGRVTHFVVVFVEGNMLVKRFPDPQ